MTDPAARISSAARVTSCDIAANLRALSIRFDAEGKPEKIPQGLASKVDQIVALFLEKRWNHPRKFDRVQPMSYALFQAPDDDPDFADDVEALRAALEAFLFGQEETPGARMEAVTGPSEEISKLAASSDEKFNEARTLSPAQSKFEEGETVPSWSPQTKSAAPKPAAAETPEAAPEADDLVFVDAEQTPAAAQTPSMAERIKMRAVYDAQNAAVVAYWAAIIRPDAQSNPIAYNDFRVSYTEDMSAFETAAIKVVAQRIASQLETGATAYCVVPLSYSTFADRRRRDAYVELGLNLPKEIRRFIIPSICGGPSQPTSSLLVEAAGAVRQSFRNLDWQTFSTQSDLTPIRDARIDTVTFVPPLKEPDRSIAMARLLYHARQSLAHGVRPGVTNLMSQHDLATALRAGVHILTGGFISDDIEQISPRLGVKPSQLPLKS